MIAVADKNKGALSNARGILNLVHILRASSLLFAVPSVVVSTPLPVPQAVRRVCKFDISKVTLIVVVVLLSLAPPPNAATLNDLTLLLSLAGTYFLPGTCTQGLQLSLVIYPYTCSQPVLIL